MISGQVEGHFGTAVASYFVLLRWLFYMNLAIFLVWTLFVYIPQFVVEPYLTARKATEFPCIYPRSLNITTYCRTPGYSNNHAVHLVLSGCQNLSQSIKRTDVVSATYCAGFGNQSARVTTLKYNITAKVANTSTCRYGPAVYNICLLNPSYDPISLVTGQGGYRDTWLFLGHYVNFTHFNGISYNRPVAYLVCTALVYGISFIMLIIK